MHKPDSDDAIEMSKAPAPAPEQETAAPTHTVMNGQPGLPDAEVMRELEAATAEGRLRALRCGACSREFNYVQPRAVKLDETHHIKVKCPFCKGYTQTDGARVIKTGTRLQRKAMDKNRRAKQKELLRRQRQAQQRMLQKGKPAQDHALVQVEGDTLTLVDGARDER